MKRIKGFIPAKDKKISKLLRDKGYKFIGNSAKNLKLNMEIMPNLTLSIT